MRAAEADAEAAENTVTRLRATVPAAKSKAAQLGANLKELTKVPTPEERG